MIYTWLFIITIIYLFLQGSNLHLMETRKASDLQNMSFPKVGTYIIDNMHHIGDHIMHHHHDHNGYHHRNHCMDDGDFR